MAWLRHGCYYYRSERYGNQVRSVYLGCGPRAALLAELDARRTKEDATSRAAWSQEREHMAAEDAEVAAVDDAIAALARVALYAAGYHQHHYGEWRKRRA